MNADNDIVAAIKKIEEDIFKIVKRRLVQEGPQLLATYYNDYLQPATISPDKRAASGRLYYSGPNESKKLRANYGNIIRALQPGGEGNITDVVIEGGLDRVYFISGIDYDTKVQAGPGTTDFEYVKWWEEGEAFSSTNQNTRPFLSLGFADFIEKEVPDILELISEDLLELYRGS
jgi:hypothetical protein